MDLTKILKDCPKGTKFYSRFLGSVEFCKITLDNYIEVIGKAGYYIGFKPNGTYQHSEENAEIDLFPSKDQRDWSKWHRPFVDGDVLSYQNKLYKNRTIYIYRHHSKMNTSYYVALSASNDFMIGKDGDALNNYNDTARFATEEEKQKLFDALKKEGYEWDVEKKELKPLQQFKDGDIVATNDGKYIAIIENNGGKYYVCCHPNVNYFNIDGSGWFDRLATEEEKQILFDTIKENGYKWNAETKTLEKLKEEKSDIKTCQNCNTFKVMHQNCPYSPIWTYKDLNVAKLHLNDETNCEFWMEIPETNILENNKFDPKTLKPFDKVLVSSNDEWFCDFFSHYDNAVVKFNCICTGGCPYECCIPYNDDTKHLIGKSIEEAPEFYRYWEE